MRRILHVMADGSIGGGASVILALGTESIDRGLEVHLLTDQRSPLVALAREAGFTVHEAPFFVNRSWLRARRVTATVIADVAPDVIHVHGARALFDVGRVLGSPVVYTVHGYHGLRRQGWRRRVFIITERHQTASVAAQTFVSDGDRAMAERFGLLANGSTSIVIRNAVASAQRSVRDLDRHPLVVFVGRLVEVKDPALAAMTFARLAGAGIACRLVGDGPMRDRVDAILATAQTVVSPPEALGQLSPHEVAALMSSASILLMTSKWEGMPMVALEAMANGLPVVCVRYDGVEHTVRDEINGLIVDSRQPDAIADAVIGLLANPARFRKLSAGALATAQGNVGKDTMMNSYHRLYDQVGTGMAGEGEVHKSAF